jgi:hypothetical protein
MAKTVNKVILLGNVGKDPEIRSTTGGTLVANLSLATSERYKDKGGEWQERTEWDNLVGYARGAEILRDYVKKGSKLERRLSSMRSACCRWRKDPTAVPAPTADWGASENNRKAKHYSLTRTGRKQLEAELENWGRISTAIALVLK